MKGKKSNKSSDRKKKIDNDQSREQRKQYFFVIRELTSREIKRKYSRSYLGIVWSVLNPLLMMTVLSMIFTQIFDRAIENYPIYYLSGYILWHMFTGATNAAMTTLIDNKNMLIKVRLPMEIFVLARVYTALVNLGYSLIAYVVMLIVFQVQIRLTVLFFPVIVLFMLLFSLGVSFVLSTAYVFFGDVKHLYSVLLTLWMYCSAIFYPVDRLEGPIGTVIELNPIYEYISATRSIVMYGGMPTVSDILKMMIWAVVMAGIGYYIFRINKNKVMQKI
ncbi:MAG TPA: ABC transporter permease [Candidatus Mediterraneibacter norfolkensis]|nr:ABC transporter permease [Candidatus Mediterraneibacter norfolkensis]